ncbi:MAG: LytB protein [Gammaproteobacteria bacterium]|jgi:colicin import membrane protein|nr:LytB protein [Gammaproteobacteria bacterium]
MITNIKYLHASLFSFCIHASIFLYLYGTFDRNATQAIFISTPLRVELKFESEIPISKQKINKQIQSVTSNKNKIIELSSLESKDLIQPVAEIPFIYSNLSELLDEEKTIELTKEQQEISLYANNIIKTVEDAWMKPKNIPEGLVANIKLRIKPNGRIIKSELIKSSGNIRFDNSALQAVRRVEAFHFFDSISSRVYEKEFKNIAISFNPL